MFSRLKEVLSNINYHLGYTRYARIEHYINNLENKFSITDKEDKRVVEELDGLIRERLRRLKRLYILNFLLFLGAYFSFFSFFLSEIILLEQVAAMLKTVVSFVGTTVFIAALFVARRFTELYYQDLNLLTSHFIAIYTKNKFTERHLFGEGNMYESFIDFFKMRPLEHKKKNQL